MPSAPEYGTIGEFYQVLRDRLQAYADRCGEASTFIGPRDVQMRAEEAGATSLRVVSNMRDALSAIDEIVRQGEGAPGTSEGSHFGHFQSIKAEYERLVDKRSSFSPSRNVGRNPVMRFPVDPARTHVTHPDASMVLDAANGLYCFMLRCLSQSYETRWDDTDARAGIVAAAFKSMRAFGGIASDLTRMPARVDGDEAAGVSFAVLRSTEGAAPGVSGGATLVERIGDFRRQGSKLPLEPQSARRLELDLARIAESLACFQTRSERCGDLR